jgi:hypothetical protein
MRKWVVNIREAQTVEGERVFTNSSHIVEAVTAIEARLSFKCFPNEKILDVIAYEETTKKPVKH